MSEKEIIGARSVKQHMFLTSDADVTCFGGAAGASKSYSGLMSFLPYIKIKTFRGVITRRTTPMLKGSGGLLDVASSLFSKVDPKVRWKSQESKFVFSSGAEIHLKHYEHLKNKDNWQGTQMNWRSTKALLSQTACAPRCTQGKHNVREQRKTIRTRDGATDQCAKPRDKAIASRVETASRNWGFHVANQSLTVRKEPEFIGVHRRACHPQCNRHHESATDSCHKARNHRLATSDCDEIIRAKGQIEAFETIHQHSTTLVSASLQPR